ncbi:hypothetical protein AB0M57_10705 [Streptomyces sp. NPDC051597]|uniref:hypothetical protein n=1 Tax=Streptomyces sp. NPDC051597 TaxID=3155049 RepID=UPI00342675FC
MEDASMPSENVSESETAEPGRAASVKAVDDQLIDELVGRAQAEGLQLTGEGEALVPVGQHMASLRRKGTKNVLGTESGKGQLAQGVSSGHRIRRFGNRDTAAILRPRFVRPRTPDRLRPRCVKGRAFEDFARACPTDTG